MPKLDSLKGTETKSYSKSKIVSVVEPGHIFLTLHKQFVETQNDKDFVTTDNEAGSMLNKKVDLLSVHLMSMSNGNGTAKVCLCKERGNVPKKFFILERGLK